MTSRISEDQIIFFFNDTATTEISTLSLHDALPIFGADQGEDGEGERHDDQHRDDHALEDRRALVGRGIGAADQRHERSEEHTSELQSRQYLVCRLLLEKKNKRGGHDSSASKRTRIR